METKSATKEEAQENRRWFVVDADGQVLGRLASQIAHILRGKHKTNYTPHIDTGDFVVVVNAGKVKLTGKKEEGKIYYHHTGWAGGVVEETAAELRERNSPELIKEAVWGMMPKGPLGRAMYSKLKVYESSEHPHLAQKPEPLAFN